MEKLQSLISIREEARAAVAEELRLELWKLPTKVAERLEAYEARIAHHVAALGADASAAVAKAEHTSAIREEAIEARKQPAAPETPATPPKAGKASDEDSAPDLADDVDDGADLF